jgi:hypothetical protein
MTINNQVTPYSDFRHPMGSIHSVSSSQPPDTSIGSLHFNLIVDSGCTRHMFPYKDLFISYKDTPSPYVILADKSKVPCFGTGTVRLLLQNKPIILHDVLHVPKLRSPLLLVRCFRHLAGCSFIADNREIKQPLQIFVVAYFVLRVSCVSIVQTGSIQIQIQSGGLTLSSHPPLIWNFFSLLKILRE